MLRAIRILVFFLSFFNPPLWAQVRDSASFETDSVARERAARKKLYSEPRKATLMSTFLPGLGQIYNKKWWKVPVIYTGLGGFGYMFYANNSQYQAFRREVIAANDNDPLTLYDTRYTPDQLQTQKLYYKKYRDFAMIGIGIIYIINIIDANVDAHLKTFDVSDNLSLQINPWYDIHRQEQSVGSAAGITFKLTMK